MVVSSYIFLPKYFTKKAIISFALTLFFCFVLFLKKSLTFQWIFFDFLEVIGFFYFAHLITNRWSKITPQLYQKKLFWVSFWIRLSWVFFSYFYFLIKTGKPFEFEAADATGYHGEAIWLVSLLSVGKFRNYLNYIGLNYADMGYPLYLGFLYYIVGEGILIPRLIKALLGAYTCVFIYKLASNSFGESVGRIAGVLSMLLPNLIYYCGLHVKETEMVFLVVVFIYYSDKLLYIKGFIFKDLLILLLTGASIFLFRTVLAVCLISSVSVAAFFVSKRLSGIGKKIGIFFLIATVSIVITSTTLGDVIYGYIKASDRNLSSQMENYSTTTNANKFAKYGSKSIFLPLMVIAPFPTLVETNQPNSMMLGGAFFTRNIYVYFVFIALITLYKRKLIMKNMLLLLALFSYLFVLSLSGFAFSERFHLPIVPFLLIFAAYGIAQLNRKNTKYYVPYLILITLIIIGWNWFKLAGRS